MWKRLTCSSLVASSALALPSLTGTVQDESKQPIADVKVAIWQAVGEKRTAISDSAGAFALTDLAEGEYLLSAEKRGSALFLGAVRLKGDAAHPVIIQMLSAKSKYHVAAGAALRTAHLLSSPEITQLHLTWKEMPVPPPKHIKGSVLLGVVMLTDGTLDDLAVLSGPKEPLAESALVAVQKWRYSPAMSGDVTHEVAFTIEVNFH